MAAGIAHPLPKGSVRTAVEGNDVTFVDHLGHEHHVLRILEHLIRELVRAADARPATADTALEERTVFRTVKALNGKCRHVHRPGFVNPLALRR